jgi:hypothetical protein
VAAQRGLEVDPGGGRLRARSRSPTITRAETPPEGRSRSVQAEAVTAADTSVVVRYLVGSPPDQAARAARLIEGAGQVALPVVVLVEAAHVLRTQYGLGRSEVLDALWS